MGRPPKQKNEKDERPVTLEHFEQLKVLGRGGFGNRPLRRQPGVQHLPAAVAACVHQRLLAQPVQQLVAVRASEHI